jgi:cytoskeleton protein RodZ
MDNMINESETPLPETLGNLLKRTRTKQKKSLEDANEATRIHLVSLQALENDDFDALPAEVFVRGFIKIYAGYLGLDPEDTIRHYTSQTASEQQDLTAPPSPRDVMTGEALAESSAFFRKHSKVIAITLLLAILVIFYGLGVIFKSSDPNDDIQDPLNSSKTVTNEAPPGGQQEDVTSIVEERGITEKPVVAPEISPAEDKPARTEPPAGSEDKPTPKSPPAESKDTSRTELPIKTSPETTLPKTVKVSTAPATTETQGNQAVEFKYVLEAKFNESSMVNITVDDQPQRQYTSQAGIVRVWKANKKITLKLDNRNNVILTLNGKILEKVNSDEPLNTINIPKDIEDKQQP